MTSQIQINVKLNDDVWVITANVLDGGTLPSDIFIYENTGGTTLGKYIGVCNLEELTRLTLWTGNPLPTFGNKFVRYTQAKITVPIGVKPDDVISNLEITASLLSSQIQSQGDSTKTVTISP